MRRRAGIACAMIAVVGGFVPARGDGLDPRIGEVHQVAGLLAAREVVATVEGDLSGDGRAEVVVAFKDPGDAPGTRGGFVILASRAGRYHKVHGGLWESGFPREVAIEDGALEAIVVEITDAGELPRRQRLRFGEEIVFDDRAGGLLSEVRIQASSTLRHYRAQTDERSVLDGDLATGWSEASRGTGVGEWIRLVFPRPVDLSLIGIAGGNQRSEAHYRLTNRLHRAEIAVRTPADEGDPAAGVRFVDLGLVFAGVRIPVRLPDRMGMHYFPLDKSEVSALEVHITSVYVGDRLDDTWIAEIDPLWRLPDPPDPTFVIAPLEGR